MPVYTYCPRVHAECHPKGVQIRQEKDNNTTCQFFPFASILSARLDYLYEDKLHTLSIFLSDSLKYHYTFRCGGEAEELYRKIVEGCNAP